LIFQCHADEGDTVSHRRVAIRGSAFGFEGPTFFDNMDIDIRTLWKHHGKIYKTASHGDLGYAPVVARSRRLVCQFALREEIVPRMNATVFATSRFAPAGLLRITLLMICHLHL
jgi:hypothetical protein